jgi:hypothetical protein
MRVLPGLGNGMQGVSLLYIVKVTSVCEMDKELGDAIK